MGVYILDFMFATPKRHILGRNRMFWRISRQNPSTALGCSESQEPKKNNVLVRKVTHARKRNAWVDRDELLHWCRGPRRNHVCRFVLRSITGFGRGGGSNFGFLHWLASSPLQHSRTTVRVCDMEFKWLVILPIMPWVWVRFIPDTIQAVAIVTMEDEKLVRSIEFCQPWMTPNLDLKKSASVT